MLAALVGIGLLAAGGLWSFFANRPMTQPGVAATTAPASEPTVVRTDPSHQPSTTETIGGGQIGQAVAFEGTQGAGTVTVTKATWTNSGIVDPEAGSMYLVLDVRYEGTSGSYPVGLIYARVVDQAGESHLIAFGPDIDLLRTQTVAAGDTVEGQLAYELPRGPATFQVLNERLESVAEVKIPG